MKKIICSVFLALVTAISLSSVASARNMNDLGGSVNGVSDANRRLSAPRICKVSKSLTCVLCAGTSLATGILVDIEISSGAIGGYVVALDTGALPSAGREPASSGAGQQIASQRTCEYTLATTGLATGQCGRKEFNSDGRPFSRGLVLCASTADTEVTATYRLISTP
jgi:hypothetical protein